MFKTLFKTTSFKLFKIDDFGVKKRFFTCLEQFKTLSFKTKTFIFQKIFCFLPTLGSRMVLLNPGSCGLDPGLAPRPHRKGAKWEEKGGVVVSGP